MKPSTTKEALDWIVVKTSLINLGYSESDIFKIYDIRINEIDVLKKIIEKEKLKPEEHYDRTKLYDDSSPFHSMLTEAKKASLGTRGPASID